MEKPVSPPSVGGDTRRNFLKKTATATAAVAATGILKTPVYGQSSAPSTGRVIGANDRIAVAVIGVGYGIGKNHLEGIYKEAGANNVTLAAACDLYSVRRDYAKEKAHLNDSDVYSNYRKILDRKDIDAVVVATHDPWHAPISIEAMDSGKHVYCEKPMTRYLGEAFQVHDAVKKTGKIFQVGSQGCSGIGWHKAAEMIQAGKIGELIWAQGYYCRNSGPNSPVTKGEWNYAIDKTSTPENIDWDAWLGPVSKRPFSADAFHRWRKYFPYCSGLLGDLVPHRMHPLMLATGNPQFPVRVTSIGTQPVGSDKYTPGTPKRDVAEHVQILAEFPGGALITVTCSSVNAKSPGFVIYGHHATLEIGNLGDKLKLIPEKEWSEEIDGVELTELVPTEDIRVHEKNWFECIRSGKQPNAGIDLAIRVQTVISLAEMSDRLKVTCLFDEKSRKITTENGREVKPITYGSLPLS